MQSFFFSFFPIVGNEFAELIVANFGVETREIFGFLGQKRTEEKDIHAPPWELRRHPKGVVIGEKVLFVWILRSATYKYVNF